MFILVHLLCIIAQSVSAGASMPVRKLWCSIHRCFHPADSFSAKQRSAGSTDESRYCLKRYCGNQDNSVDLLVVKVAGGSRTMHGNIPRRVRNICMGISHEEVTGEDRSHEPSREPDGGELLRRAQLKVDGATLTKRKRSFNVRFQLLRKASFRQLAVANGECIAPKLVTHRRGMRRRWREWLQMVA